MKPFHSPLPIRNGVAASHQYLPQGDWETIWVFLLHRFPSISAEVWLQRIEKGEVVYANGQKVKPDDPYRAHDRIFYYREIDNEPEPPFAEEILFQDEHLVVVDKPPFMTVTPKGKYLQQSLLVRLKKKLRIDELTPIHRLDRETAGVVLFSRNAKSRGDYQSMFQKREMKKVYEALAPCTQRLQFPLVYKSRLVDGEPFFRSQEIEGEANTETQIEVIRSFGDVCLYRLRPITGRKHQLRVHMASLGIPIVNDTFYPDLNDREQDDFSKPLQLLARSISFADPYTAELRHFESKRQLELPFAIK